MSIEKTHRFLDRFLGDSRVPMFNRRELGISVLSGFTGGVAGAVGGALSSSLDTKNYGHDFFIYDPTDEEHKKAYAWALHYVNKMVERDGVDHFTTKDIVDQFKLAMKGHQSSPPLLVAGKDKGSVLQAIECGLVGAGGAFVFQNAMTQPDFSRRAFLKTAASGAGVLGVTAGAGMFGTIGYMTGQYTDEIKSFANYVVFDPSDADHIKAYDESLAAIDHARKEASKSGAPLTPSQITQQFLKEMSGRVPVSVVQFGATAGTVTKAVLFTIGGTVIGHVLGKTILTDMQPAQGEKSNMVR